MPLVLYNISPQIKNNLKVVDLVRTKIHLSPLSLDEELKHKWEALINRVWWSLNLAEVPISKDLVTKVISSPPNKKLSNPEKDILNYKEALDYIKYTWLGSKQKITYKEVKYLYDIAAKPTLGSSEITFKTKKQQIERFLEYLDTENEHPVLQSGIAYIQTYMLSSYTSGLGRLARLMAYLFLYKHGYDFRGLMVFEEFMRKDLVGLRTARETVEKYNTLTPWLEYWVFAIGRQAEVALNDIVTPRTNKKNSYLKLNSRHREIVKILDNPETRITNRDLQSKFKVSQITASRDLAKLSNLGFLARRGNGRSYYYVRGELI